MSRVKTDACWYHVTGEGVVAVYGKDLRYTKYIKARTSVAAEVIAVIHGVLKSDLGGTVYNDNKPVIDVLMSGKALKGCRELCANALKLIASKHIELRWVNRGKNREADKLARDCVKERIRCEKQSR